MLGYIAADAEDRVIVVDESLLGVLDAIAWEFEHVIVVSHSGSVPGRLGRLRAADRLGRAGQLAGDR